jgi:hypothetical protein
VAGRPSGPAADAHGGRQPQAQVADYQDTSAWSRVCYLTVDKTPPATTPIVTSHKYATTEDGSGTGGEGVPGTFVLDAGGDRDTVAFMLSDDWYAKFPTSVTANHPGGKARVTVTPQYGGRDTLHVTAIDGAGNRGATTDYQFDVRWTGLSAAITVNGVGVPSPVTFSATQGIKVTSYAYLMEGGASEVTVPATGNRATTSIVSPGRATSTCGSAPTTARSWSASGHRGSRSATRPA